VCCYRQDEVEFEFEEANGAYTQVAGWAGTVTIELGVNNSSARAVTSGSPASPTKVTDTLPPLWDTNDVELEVIINSDVAKILDLIFFG
jgi:hypothetical protein